ncbi:MAG: ABC transporter ATP-binding protein [Planctomycetes bacterium]|nr:ABC transporter ATP-binding protein [Planctomycetota bacterium]
MKPGPRPRRSARARRPENRWTAHCSNGRAARNSLDSPASPFAVWRGFSFLFRGVLYFPARCGTIREPPAARPLGGRAGGLQRRAPSVSLTTNEAPVLDVRDLKTYFFTDDGVVKAVDGVSYQLYAGQTLGVVGESGCGKSVTSLSIMRLIAWPPGKIVGGEVVFEGTDLLRLSESRMRAIRGNKVSMIFQEPMTSLNPVFTVGEQIMESIVLHQKKPPREARKLAIEMLNKVGIPSPQQRVDDYPHQMSGGMKQRVMIAMALACSPRVLIADEPTTALDVTIQAQILELMRHLQREFGMSILLITHDLAVVAETADQVVVMYASKVVEHTDVRTLFREPAHPYTQGLFKSLPRIDHKAERLSVIEGTVPSPLRFPPGCKFHPRCPHAFDRCKVEEPALKDYGGHHLVACWLMEPH